MHTLYVFQDEVQGVFTFARAELAKEAFTAATNEPTVNVAVLYTNGKFDNSYTRP